MTSEHLAWRPWRTALPTVVLGVLVAASPALASPATRPSTTAPDANAGVRTPALQLTPTLLTPSAARQPRSGRVVIPFLTMDPDALQAAKLRAGAQASVGNRTPILSQPSTAQAGLFNNLNNPGLSDYAVTPPDSTGAIGPSHYVEMVNQQVGVYDRSLNSVSSTDLTSFVAASGWTVSDPQIQWDGQANRWLYAAVGVATGNNVLLFGWSKTADPSDLSNGWCRFGVGRGQWLDDYPKLGHDDNFLTIGSNVYDDSTGYTFATAEIWAIPKPAYGSSSCTAPASAYGFATPASPLRNADGSHAYTPVPANTVGTSPAGYIVAAHYPLAEVGDPPGPRNKVMIWHVASSGGTPQLVADGDVTVASFDVPAPVPQPGSALTLDSLDTRLTQAVAAPDPGAGGALAIWTQHTVAGTGGRSVVHWYELVPGTPLSPLRQQGEVASATDFIFNAAISPTATGDAAAIFYNRGGSAQLPVIGALSRSGSTPLGQMDPGELVLGTSSAVDQDYSCSTSTPCRWGDYSGATPDPLNTGVVWGSNQLTGGCFVICGWFSQWQTRNFAVVASTSSPPPATPPSAPQSLTATAGDGSVDLGWILPTSDGGATITGYQVWRGTSPGSETLLTTLGNVLSYTDAAVTNGTTYYYQVAAVNSAGPGALSNEASATPTGAPSAPQSLNATPGDGDVGLSWSAPASDGGLAISNYQIWRGTSSSGESLLTTIGNVLTYTDTTVSNGTTYFYEVRAVNSAGPGSFSNEASATPTATGSVPTAPQNLTVAKVRTGGLVLSWSPPALDGGSAILSYEIWRGSSSGQEALYATVYGSTTTSYFDGAATGKRVRYYYEVRAVNGVGAGPFSNEVWSWGR